MTRFGVMKHLSVARAGGPDHDPQAGSPEAAFPQPGPDPAGPRPLGQQVHGALGGDAQRTKGTTGGRHDDGCHRQRRAALDRRADEKVFEIYIRTTPERLWEAITDPQLRQRYSFGLEVHSDWQAGSEYELSNPQAGKMAIGENLEVEPPRRLVQSFTALWSEDVQREGASRVTWEIEPVGDSCRLTVTHDQLRADAHGEIYGGWPQILSGLKTLLETGEDLTTPGSLRYTGASA